jgi:hypothetical protein
MNEGPTGNYSRTFSDTYIPGIYNISIYADKAGFTGDAEFLSFRILDTSPPTRISNLSNITDSTWINWSWENPEDIDFDHVLIYVNGEWITATSNEYYLAEGLTPNTEYEIGIHTVDKVGNINTRWINQTTKTTGFIDTIPPVITITVPYEDEALQDGVTFETYVTDQSGVNFVNISIREPGGDHGIIINESYESLSTTYIGEDIWQLPFDTTGLPDGYYLLFVEACDILGNMGNNTVNFSIRNWAVIELLPSTNNHKAGRTMPVKFSLRIAEAVDPAQPFVRNEELNILIYEEDFPETILQNSTYGNTSTDYRIESENELYITNFKTLKKPTVYVVEIWRKDMLLDSFEFETVK